MTVDLSNGELDALVEQHAKAILTAHFYLNRLSSAKRIVEILEKRKSEEEAKTAAKEAA